MNTSFLTQNFNQKTTREPCEGIQHYQYAGIRAIVSTISALFQTYNFLSFLQQTSVIFLPAHPASFTHNFISGVQSCYSSESQDAMVLQTCYEK